MNEGRGPIAVSAPTVLLSEVMAGSMTTADGTADVAVRLTYKPRDPHALIVTITDRAGVVQIWTIGRDLLLRGLIAQASRPAGRSRITRRSRSLRTPGSRSAGYGS